MLTALAACAWNHRGATLNARPKLPTAHPHVPAVRVDTVRRLPPSNEPLTAEYDRCAAVASPAKPQSALQLRRAQLITHYCTLTAAQNTSSPPPAPLKPPNPTPAPRKTHQHASQCRRSSRKQPQAGQRARRNADGGASPGATWRPLTHTCSVVPPILMHSRTKSR